ncbi:MAG: hypothetical protein ACK5MD_03720 [Flavobacteriales bacterium]
MIKYAVFIFLILTFILFGSAAYYHFIEPDEMLYQRFMGFGTVALMFLVVPSFLLWGHFKRQKRKNQD